MGKVIEKHTQGPFYVSGQDVAHMESRDCFDVDVIEDAIGTVVGYAIRPIDARLFAASSDMSAILKEFLADCNEYWGDGDAQGRAMRFADFEERMMAHSQDAETAIDKAKGEV